MSHAPTSGRPSGKPNPYHRSQARRRALQALYQWDLTGEDVSEIDTQFRVGQEMDKVDVEYFSMLLSGCIAAVDSLDEALAPHMNIPVAECDPIERNVLRIGAFELSKRPDVPARVVINETVELAKAFGGEGGHKFVNGVIDKLAKAVRQVEMK